MEAEGEKAKGLSKRKVAGATGPGNTDGTAPWGPMEEFGWDLGCLCSRAVVFTARDTNPCREQTEPWGLAPCVSERTQCPWYSFLELMALGWAVPGFALTLPTGGKHKMPSPFKGCETS